MLKFLEGLLDHADDIAYGAGTEIYDRMLQDTADRHTKFTKWGSQLQTDLNERKKSLQLQQGNYNEAMNSLKNLPPDELNKELLLKNIDIDTYLAPLASQLGTGMFLGDRNEILNRIMHFLKEAPIKTGTPFVPAENYFEQNFDKLDNQIQRVSGMGYNTWRTLTKRGELDMVDDASRVKFKEEDRLRSDLEVSSMSAKALGILNTYPGTIEGNQNLQFQQVSLIVANARAQFPDDLETREDFIAKKLPENGINPMDALLYHNSVQFAQISKVIDQYGSRTANEMAEIINQLKNPELSTEAVARLNEQLSQLTLSQHKLLNEYSLQIPGILAGEDVDLGIDTDTTKDKFIVPQVAKNYLPIVNNKGELTIEYDNGETQNLSLEMLINNPENLKGIPTVAQEYILKIQDSLFEDGKMIEPTREMFNKGNAGDKAFKDFLEIYFGFNPEIGLTGQTGKGGAGLHYTFSNWFKNVYEGTKRIADPGDGTRRGPGELRVKQYADINQFITNEVASSLTTDALTAETDKEKIEELKSGTEPILDESKQPIVEDQIGSQFKTRVSGKDDKNINRIKTILEDSNIQKDKQKSFLKKLQEEFGTTSLGKIKEEFGTPSVGMSGTLPNLNKALNIAAVDTALKTVATDTVFNDWIIEQHSKKYQTENKQSTKDNSKRLLLLKINVPKEAESQIKSVANALAGQGDFSNEMIVKILTTLGHIESDAYATQIQYEGGPARSYWQIEPSTAKSILDENLKASVAGRDQILGPRFEQLFEGKYITERKGKSALAYFASLNQEQLSDLLLDDGLFAAMMAGHKVVTTFDPLNSKRK